MISDAVLKLLIEGATGFADRTDGRAEQSITLLSGGMLVSGTIITSREYALSNVWLEAIDESGRKSPPSEFDAGDFIHLKDARFYTPGSRPIPDDEGVFWRGRIDHISGYFLGHLKLEKA